MQEKCKYPVNEPDEGKYTLTQNSLSGQKKYVTVLVLDQKNVTVVKKNLHLRSELKYLPHSWN